MEEEEEEEGDGPSGGGVSKIERKQNVNEGETVLPKFACASTPVRSALPRLQR